MGKGKKADPAKVAAKKAKQAAKQEKSALKANKKEMKMRGEDEEDIEAILAEHHEREMKRTAVTVSPCAQPSPRSNFSLTALPNNEFLLFGGEYCDGESTKVYNELYRWNIDKNEWKVIESLNTPSPRCSHQAVFFKDKVYIFGGEYATLDQFHHYRDMWALDLKTNVWEEIATTKDGPSARSGHRMVVWRNCIILFGGFYEALREVKWFADLYIFSLSERKWIEVPSKPYVPAPRARSGFLMTVHPSDDAVFVFGGYSKEKNKGSGSSGSAAKKSEGKVHTDMWMLSLKGAVNSGKSSNSSASKIDIGKISWQKLSNKGSPPSVRCGASMTSYKNKGIYFGGVRDSEGPRHTMLSTFFNDLYAFDFERKRWYQLGLKKPKAPKKSRSGKKKSKLKASPEDLDEDMEGASVNESSDESSDDDDDDDMEVGGVKMDAENSFGYIDDDGNIVYVSMENENMEREEKKEAVTEEADEENGVVEGADEEWVTISEEEVAALETSAHKEKSSHVDEDMMEVLSLTEENLLSSADAVQHDNESHNDEEKKFESMTGVECNNLKRYFIENSSVPVPRINASLVIKGCSLLVYGGLTEIGDVEVTLDDCWSLDLNKRDQWKNILPGTMGEMIWKGEDDLGSEMTGETGSDYDDSESGDSEDEQEVKARKASKHKGKVMGTRRGEATGIRSEMQSLKSRLPGNGEDTQQIPISVACDGGYRVENVKEFYGRAKLYWKQSAINLWNEHKVFGNIPSENVTVQDGDHDQLSESTQQSKLSALETLKSFASQGRQEFLSEKEIKKVAFLLCQERYEEVVDIASQLVELEWELAEEPAGDRRHKKSGKAR